MQFTQDDIAAIIGTKELELIHMRRQNAQQAERIAELEAKHEPKEPAKPKLEEVEG